MCSWVHFVPQDAQEASKTNLGGFQGALEAPGRAPGRNLMISLMNLLKNSWRNQPARPASQGFPSPATEFNDFFNEFIEEFIKKSTSQAGQPGISQPSQDSEGTTAGEKDNKEKQNNYILKKSKLPINRFSGPILLVY